MKQLSDDGLLQLIKSENHLAFTILVDRYWTRLYQHLFSRIRNEDDAEDAVQEIFIGFWKNKSTIICNHEDSLGPYLFSAAKYCAIDYFSKPETAIPYENALETVLEYASSDCSDEVVLLHELRQIINTEIANLPDRLRQPYLLSREDHLSIKEIANQLQLSEQTVKNNISTVLSKLKIKVDQYNSDVTITLIVILASLRG